LPVKACQSFQANMVYQNQPYRVVEKAKPIKININNKSITITVAAYQAMLKKIAKLKGKRKY